MVNNKNRKAAKEFSKKWEGIGYEKGDSQRFWMSLLQDVYGIEKPADYIIFEEKVKLDNTSFIDAHIPSTHVMIEQKSINKDLNKPIKQSDGSLITPFQQAKRYSLELPYSARPRWIVTCNFKEFFIYDMEKPNGDPEIVKLKNLENEYYRLNFLVNIENTYVKKQEEVSIVAGEVVGKLYNALLKEYLDPDDELTLKSLNILCVRLVFCLYAGDADLFGKKNMFYDYLYKYKDANFRGALIDLFKVLNQKEDERDPYIEDDLAQFPYVNGGLFNDEKIIIPKFTKEIIDILLNDASLNFDWSHISPTIFGSVFESTLNPETRKRGGMHYTSIQNIHKVIDPLFMDDFIDEFENILKIKVYKKRKNELIAFQNKISTVKFLDPASGSGNFLTETYISLRRLENSILKELIGNQIILGDFIENPIKVSISQFYGIEINDFAVTVSRTALWIAEAQMMSETEDIIHTNIDFLPLKSNSNIVEGNAIKINWNDIVDRNDLNYIIGNPPFVGHNIQNYSQRNDISSLVEKYKTSKVLDYVCAWYIKASEFIINTTIEVAFVSTNSISQGEQVYNLWSILDQLNIKINFAYQSFKWDSEAKNKATVFCVIIGFAQFDKPYKKLFSSSNQFKVVNTINGYLMDAPKVLIKDLNHPICDVPEIRKGNQPTDNGNLIIEEKDLKNFIKKDPLSKKYIKKLVGAKEYLNRSNRYCLWLVDCSIDDLSKMPLVNERIKKVREFRLKSTDTATVKKADTPMLFRETNNPETYIIIPASTSSDRRYIPIGFLDSNTIPTNLVQIIPNANLYHFGVLTSNVHTAWMRAVCGRQGNGYRYSKKQVYNNFPWPNPTSSQIDKIEYTAQNILTIRKKYEEIDFKTLYHEVKMPPDLRKAHQENDIAVMEAYNFDWKKMNEMDCVSKLFELYMEIKNEN
ncbi:DNA methyltransferase [Macrococcoides caseolyticum]|nr:class I SAM-dependent DNA methyltransferase [Macrococcus caseolyticus]RKO13812.1 class I SAM-dependent DNA methyltransferase [Macrococcus caseolyticus]